MYLNGSNPLEGKRVLITGGTGSLGTAILRRAHAENWNTEFTVMARTESRIAQVRKEYPHVRAEIGDVRDLDWLRTIFPGHQVIIHAAALKIVPTAEANVREAILTNIVGSMNVAQAAVDAGVERVIGILTDKEVLPTTVYGTTKKCAGAVLREANNWGKTLFINCRYGNVLGSRASILELLFKLKKEDKPFVITDKRCTRFWLLMQDAIDLILLSAEQEYPGVTVVPKAAASSVLALFEAVDPSREVIDAGIRPGEKIHEMLVDPVESLHTVDMGDYFLIYPPVSKVATNLPDQYQYTSDNPAKVLSINDLKEMILLSEHNTGIGEKVLIA